MLQPHSQKLHLEQSSMHNSTPLIHPPFSTFHQTLVMSKVPQEQPQNKTQIVNIFEAGWVQFIMWDKCGAEQRQLVGEAPTLADEISLVVAMHSQRGLRCLMRWVFWLTKSCDRAKIERVGTQVSLDQVWRRLSEVKDLPSLLSRTCYIVTVDSNQT